MQIDLPQIGNVYEFDERVGRIIPGLRALAGTKFIVLKIHDCGPPSAVVTIGMLGRRHAFVFVQDMLNCSTCVA